MNNTEESCDGAILSDSPTAPATCRTPSKPRQRHGLTGLIRGRSRAVAPKLDARSLESRAVAAYRADLFSSLGGRDMLSAQEITLVEMCSRDWFILQSIDSYLLQAGLFHRKKKTAYPLTIQRQTIADGLTRRLLALGLNRRSKPVNTLAELLSNTPQTEHS
jgi:hypothetical protein